MKRISSSTLRGEQNAMVETGCAFRGEGRRGLPHSWFYDYGSYDGYIKMEIKAEGYGPGAPAETWVIEKGREAYIGRETRFTKKETV